jgi:hypothetical protein
LDAFGVSSFQSVWYWAMHVVVWTLCTHRTLGVPYDMLLRARRLPEVALRVETIARFHAERVAGLYHVLGTTAALLAGFLLAGLFGFGFLIGVELAQATFLILFPLAVLTYSTVSTALKIWRRGFRGDLLVQILSRRHFWHQMVAVCAMLGAFAAAVAEHPRMLGP